MSAFGTWQVAQVVAVILDHVEGLQQRLMAPASGPQRTEVRRWHRLRH